MSGHSQLSLFRISEIQGDEGSNSFKDRTNESFLTPFISHQDSLPDHKQVIVNILFDQLSLLFQCGNNICGSYILMVRQNDRMIECQCLFHSNHQDLFNINLLVEGVDVLQCSFYSLRHAQVFSTCLCVLLLRLITVDTAVKN